ncbi:MAG: putative metal-binding motif-containing protein [Desulfosalsimonadaceae bacterium]
MKTTLNTIIMVIVFLMALSITQVHAVTLTVGSGNGDVGSAIEIPITVDNPEGIAGAAFTLVFSSSLSVSVESSFFATFVDQFAACGLTQDEIGAIEIPAGYSQPIITNESLAGDQIKIAAARCQAATAGENHVLFTLNVSLKNGEPAGIYAIQIIPTTLNSTAAGYDAAGETIDLLIGSNPGIAPPDPLAFPTILEAAGYAAHVVPGQVEFVSDIPPEDVDDDGDGYTENQGDLNDSDNSIYPNAEEICGDGIDQDCNGSDLVCPEDGDDDGIADGVDNCPLLFNPDQADSDADGIGDVCDENVNDGIGLFDPAGSTFYLRNELSAGNADTSFRFGAKNAGWQPLAGDWDGDGQCGIGLFDPLTNTFFLKDFLTGSNADYTFRFGPRNAGWQPLTGDWDGDGQCGFGLFDPLTNTFFLKNAFSNGKADYTFRFGPKNAGWQPITGDWDGDGQYSIGLFDPSTGTFFLRNAFSNGSADITFHFGPRNAGWRPITGDWDSNGIDGIGLYNPATSSFYLKNGFSVGNSDVSFRFGPAGKGWVPLAGSWE